MQRWLQVLYDSVLRSARMADREPVCFQQAWGPDEMRVGSVESYRMGRRRDTR